MPYIPHTPEETAAMLKDLGIDAIEPLFDEIPSSLTPPSQVGFHQTGLSEAALTRLMLARQPAITPYQFTGAGAYEHHIPAIIGDILSRGEFYSAYTPYQAEASQGSLQVIYEYQSKMTQLLAMEVSNASLYDGASALAEAVLMACRIQRQKQNKIILPRSLHPSYRHVLRTLLTPQQIDLIEIDFNPQGQIDLQCFTEQCANAAAVIIPQCNFFGLLEDVNALTDIAHQHQALAIGVINPLSCAALLPPGRWGERGVDIACGEGQPLGVPLAGGGPYFGILCTRKQYIRQLPGRIVAKTEDLDGRCCYTLTLQAREQHIRRKKATSNICTNQGLMVVAATVFMHLHGAAGCQHITECCHENTQLLIEKLCNINGVERVFQAPSWQEDVIRFTDAKTANICAALEAQNIQGGFNLTPHFPALGECLLVCATETKTKDDIQHYVDTLTTILGKKA